MLDRWASLVVRRARTVIAVTLLLTLGFASQLPHLALRFDRDASFPPDDPAVRIDREIRVRFGGRNFVVLVVVPSEGSVWRQDVLTAVRDLTLAIRDLPGVMEHTLVSLAAPSARRVEVTDDGIREEYLMRDVPETAEDIARLRRQVMGDPLLRGGVVTEDERAAVVVADFWPETPAEEIARGLVAASASVASPQIAVHATGEPLFVAASEAYVRTVPFYLGAAVLVMMLVLLAAFRSWQGMLLPLATGLLATLWGLGLMALTGIPLSFWNQSVPTLVVIVAAGHSAQMLKRYAEERETLRDDAAAVELALARIAPVMLAAGGTAAAGFASMAVTGIPGMVDFGVSAAYGIASAVVLELSFMPALRSRLHAVPPTAGRGLDPIFARLAALPGTRRGRALVLAGAATTLLWAVAGVPRLRTAGPVREYLPKGHAVTRDLEVVRAHFPGTVALGILFEGPPGSATTPEALSAMDRLARALAAHPNVARTASLADLVKELNAVFTPGGARDLPADPPLLAQLLFLGRGPGFERFVDRADAHAVLWAYLRSDTPRDVGAVMTLARREAAALPLPPGAKLHVAGGQGPLELALDERVTRGKISTLGILLAVIWSLASLVLRSAVAGIFVVVPLVLAAAVTFGLVAWNGVALDIMTASILATSVGIGADYSIYFLHRLREEQRRGRSLEAALARALDTAGRAVAFVAVAIALGFLVFVVSAYEAFRLTALLTPAGMLASCAAALTVMPAALVALRPAFLLRSRTHGALPDGGRPS
jgi:predicted RND superfamily exporter protein